MINIYVYSRPNSVRVPIALEETGLDYVLNDLSRDLMSRAPVKRIILGGGTRTRSFSTIVNHGIDVRLRSRADKGRSNRPPAAQVRPLAVTPPFFGSRSLY